MTEAINPWERRAEALASVPTGPDGLPVTLADYKMNPARDPMATVMAEHVFFSRETATGGRGVGGSGCGCN